MTKKEAETRVARGAAYLDQARPGWWSRIDVGTLDLSCPCMCVIGQLRDAYRVVDWGHVAIGMDDVDFTVEHGILVTGRNPKQDYRLLQDAWIDAIAARRHPVTDGSVVEELVTA